ncbi:FeoA family protein [Cyanobium sp. CH-040]|uniref:FeoA family protein n=1 Tax=Cyanobium sp. CH-040 TaxID=2823708 RepID=UPI0020CC0340|nr:FeoA family protein [Cyanobium sp. CH-040]MCP9928874.1 ferrous iron transport protein A [Cyanobium sp. CH-040]
MRDPNRPAGQRRRRWRLGWGTPPGLAAAAAAWSTQETQGEPAFPLTEARIEERLWIADIQASQELREKLNSMGLYRGGELRVVVRGDRDSHLVAVANSRLGLDGAMSRAIQVRRSGIEIASRAEPTSNRSIDASTTAMPSDTTDDRAFSTPSNPPAVSAASQERLQDLPAGSRGSVEGYREGSRTYRQKLLSMGLTPGTAFEVTRHAPMGDPVEIRVRGFSLMLRKQEADMLIISVTHNG